MVSFILWLHLSISIASDSVRDIVFDLDWTLVAPLKENRSDPQKTIIAKSEPYRLMEGAVELIFELSKVPGVRISFFSGGDPERNQELLKKILLPDGRTPLSSIAFKILSKNDMIEVETDLPKSPKPRPFHKRFKKDLRKINPNLSQVVLIDDVKDFVPKSQSSHLFWTGPTFDYFESFVEAQEALKGNPLNAYIPKTYAEWAANKYRWVFLKEKLVGALREKKDWTEAWSHLFTRFQSDPESVCFASTLSHDF